MQIARLQQELLNRSLTSVAALLLTTSTAVAQQTSSLPGPVFSLPTHVVAGGGGMSTAGPYTLVGTIGQVGASIALVGGPYSLAVGFEPTIDAKTYLPFTDDPLVAGSSLMRALHVTELRERVDAVRAKFGLGPSSYANPTLTPGVTALSAQHLLDLRAALAAAYAAAGQTPPTFASPVAIGAPIAATAIAELRAAVIALE